MTRTAELEHLPRRFGLTSRKFRISYKLVGHIAALIEAAIVVIVGVATGLGYRAYVYGAVQDFEPLDLDVSIGLGVVSAILYVLTARFSQLYQVQTLLSPGRRRGSVALRVPCTMVSAGTCVRGETSASASTLRMTASTSSSRSRI